MQPDNIRIMCPSLTCRKILAVPVSSRGKNVRCRNCGATIRVPESPPAMNRSQEAPKPEAAQTGAAQKGADSARAA